jgi:hypothetical protein
MNQCSTCSSGRIVHQHQILLKQALVTCESGQSAERAQLMPLINMSGFRADFVCCSREAPQSEDGRCHGAITGE